MGIRSLLFPGLLWLPPCRCVPPRFANPLIFNRSAALLFIPPRPPFRVFDLRLFSGFCIAAVFFYQCPGGEMAAAQDLKSCCPKGQYEFESRPGYNFMKAVSVAPAGVSCPAEEQQNAQPKNRGFVVVLPLLCPAILPGFFFYKIPQRNFFFSKELLIFVIRILSTL